MKLSVRTAILFVILAVSVLGFLVRSSFAADKLRVSNCYIGGAILPLWLAKDAGFYAREGLDVEQISIQGNPAVSSLVAGEVDLLYCIPHNVISAMAGGADLQFIASVYNRMQYRIVAAPGIDKVEQLKGKLLGIARIHDVSHFYVRLALKKFAMNVDQDVRVISTGGQADRTLALKNGRVAATILNPAYAMSLERDGFKTILDVETLNFPVVGNMSAVRWAFLKEKRPVAVRFVRALAASMKKIQDDPELAKKVLAKNLRLQDKALIEENYRFNSGRYLESFPTLPIEGIRYAIDSLVPTVPAAKNLRVDAIIDASILADAAR